MLRELADKAEPLEPIALSILTRLRFRGSPGDALLSADLLAALNGDEPAGRLLAVDLDIVADAAASYGEAPGCYLNVRTGESVIGLLAHSPDVDEEYRVDVEGEDWIHLELERPEWQDMEAFAESRDGREREALERSIHGSGAFKRFRAAVDALDLWGEWQARVEELRWGELRELLREHGIVPV